MWSKVCLLTILFGVRSTIGAEEAASVVTASETAEVVMCVNDRGYDPDKLIAALTAAKNEEVTSKVEAAFEYWFFVKDNESNLTREDVNNGALAEMAIAGYEGHLNFITAFQAEFSAATGNACLDLQETWNDYVRSMRGDVEFIAGAMHKYCGAASTNAISAFTLALLLSHLFV